MFSWKIIVYGLIFLFATTSPEAISKMALVYFFKAIHERGMNISCVSTIIRTHHSQLS